MSGSEIARVPEGSWGNFSTVPVAASMPSSNCSAVSRLIV